MNKAPHSEIARRAYAIWEREGRPHGRDFDHWLKAEREAESDALAVQDPQMTVPRATPVAAKRATTRARNPKKTRS